MHLARFTASYCKYLTAIKLTKLLCFLFLFYKGESKPFDEVVKHFGDPQGFGQPPITSMRQVGTVHVNTVSQLNTC